MDKFFIRVGIQKYGGVIWFNSPKVGDCGFQEASLQEIFSIHLSNFLLIAALPHFPFAQVNLLLEYHKLIAPNSNMRSLRWLVFEVLPFLPPFLLSSLMV